MLCYGLEEGFRWQVEKFAGKYYMMDTLKLDGVTIGRCGEKGIKQMLVYIPMKGGVSFCALPAQAG